MPSTEHEALVEQFLSAPVVAQSLEESRAGFDAMLCANPIADDASVEGVKIGHMTADWVSVPESDASRALLHLHGGGYTIGSNVGYREFAARLARATRARVLVIDYRLAPENPFPAAVDDAVMAYRHLLGEGLGANQILITGDSAGGGLALSTLVVLRDAGDPTPAGAVCLSPWVDLECTGASAGPGAVDDPMVSLDALRDMATSYAAEDLRNPLVSPLHAELAGLPPVQVYVGSREILLDDATRIVDKAEAAGVDVSLEVGDGLIHVWPAFPIPEAAQTLEKIGAFADQRLG